MLSKVEIINRISVIARSEGKIKKQLAMLVRELLSYVPSTGDIETLNRLLGVLTPANKKRVTAFFQLTLEWKFEKKEGSFSKKITNEEVKATRLEERLAFLSQHDCEFWDWVKAPNKEVDYKKKLTNALKSALDPDKGGLSQTEAITALLEGGLDIRAVIAMMKG